MEFKKTTRVSDLTNLVVTGKALGQVIGVSERQVRNLSSEGKILKTPSGSYELVPALRFYIQNLKRDSEATKSEIKDTENYNKEKTLHERAKRQKAELQLGQMRGELHKSEVVEVVMTDMLSTIRSKLLAIPVKMAPILIGRDNISEIQEILESEIYEALKNLSEYEPELFIDDSYVEEFEEDVSEVLSDVDE